MSTLTWQKVRVPPVERLILADLAARWGQSDEDALVRIIREAAQRELQGELTEVARRAM